MEVSWPKGAVCGCVQSFLEAFEVDSRVLGSTTDVCDTDLEEAIVQTCRRAMISMSLEWATSSKLLVPITR